MRGGAKAKAYRFKGKIWKHKGKGGWHFITLPAALSKKIRTNHGFDEEGWGRLKTSATIGQSKWKTAIWYDLKLKAYLLPLKELIRRSEKIDAGSTVIVTLLLDDSSRPATA